MRYFAGFPRVRGFIERTIAAARETGVVKTMFGRRRLVPELTSRNGQVRAAAERVTVNMPIQGTAADILKRAMIDVHAAIAGLAARSGPAGRMILTVHDELLFEVPRARAEELGAIDPRTHAAGGVARRPARRWTSGSAGTGRTRRGRFSWARHAGGRRVAHETVRRAVACEWAR